MQSKEFITEDNKDWDTIDSWVTAWSQDARRLKKLSEFSQYQKPSSNEVYRLWSIPPTRAMELLRDSKPLVLKAKRKVISYSWTAAGAKSITADGYEHRGVMILVKHKLKPNTVFFNLYQWGVDNPKYPDSKLIKTEKEVLLISDSEYLTINPADVVNAKQANKELDNWAWG